MDNNINKVYINSTGMFLPGEPIGNAQITEYLGIPGDPKKARKSQKIMSTILNQNGIEYRHYALDKNGEATYLNSELAANAVGEALSAAGLSLSDIDMLSLGTSMGDLVLPGFGNMVHNTLKGSQSFGMVNASGVCSSGMIALQSAWLAIRAGLYSSAVAGGAERSSAVLKASRFSDGEVPSKEYFSTDFLRYMLSDGAGAAVLQNKPAPGKLSLRVEWIENRSYSSSYDICMSCGTKDPKDLKAGGSWLDMPTVAEAEQERMMVFRQDTRHLKKHICNAVVVETRRLIESGRFVDTEIDHYLPHLSSLYFDSRLQKSFLDADINISRDKWFINLVDRGNTGGGGIFVTLHDLCQSGRLKVNDTILMLLPESSTTSIGHALFKVVEG